MILLDEVEQVFRNRTDEADLRQKFLTSALLPPLKRVRDKESVILLIATNFIGDFDEAAKRIGRIDLILPVGPPNEAQRTALILSLLNYDAARAGEVAKLFPDGVTIGELKAIKKIDGHDQLSPEALYREWRKMFPSGPSISRAQLDQFAKDERDYSRFH